ncbi:disease resistance protein RPM1-like [Coffea arabica]|uniref:Disease resistance protein RPM1-like n=1 Tax=Coffea arabica TaxID=13443 RepID=A0A6P6S4K9_COFAR|nr:disease resistance protein RPM1-like [Coffea arabica]
MADGAVNYLLDKLTTILLQNASVLGNARNEIEKIKLELETMKSFLRDAERRKERSESVETWVRQVREVAIEVENTIDEFIYYNGTKAKKNGLKDFVQETMNLPRKLTVMRRLSSEMQSINAKVLEVSERSKRYAFDAKFDEERTINLPTDWLQHLGESSVFADEDDIVGIDENKARLYHWLTGNEQRRTVVSIVGMGGLGKTTLVTKVFNDQVIKRHFDSLAWISVSQAHQIEGLLRSMVKEFLKTEQAMIPRNLGSMNYRQLMEMLIEYLHNRRYLVVLDDVWSIDLWSRIRGAFPVNLCGSRIVLTTRDENVAMSVGPGSRVHRLEPLQEHDAWTLFCTKAFWNGCVHQCPPELEALAKAILRKCEGLPLAIVAIGGLMCSKSKTAIEWKKVHDSLNWQFSYNPLLERVKGILMMSFNDLPFYLKYCFLYCCIFPDGYLIKRKKLIRLWIAEGFILERKGMTMEEVAEDHLMELILRSMIQVKQINDNGRVKTFRVHDVMRELAMTTSERENFCRLHDSQESKISRNVQRLSVYNRGKNLRLNKTTSRHLRSLFVFGTDTCSSFSLNAVSSNFKFLRVLALENIPIEKLPNELVDLFNLRYLNLRNTKVKDLPKAIDKLKNLETLDVRHTNLEKLPKRILKLEKLRHLFVCKNCVNRPKNFKFSQGLRLAAGIGTLLSLQSLSYVEAEEGIIKQVGYLTNLKRLDITKVKTCDGPNLCRSIQMMTSLHRLSVTASAEEEELLLEDLVFVPPFLQKLELIGRLKRLPQWFESATNLTHLCLEFSHLQEDFLPSLQKLPSLVFLQIKKAYSGKHLKFIKGGFPKLSKLHLEELLQLDCVEIEEGSLPSLKELALIRCLALKLLPEGIEHITSLQNLQLEEMAEELVESVQIDGSENHKKVQHIHTVNLVL